MVERARGGSFGGDATPETEVPTGAQAPEGVTVDDSRGSLFQGDPTASSAPTGPLPDGEGLTTDSSRGSLFQGSPTESTTPTSSQDFTGEGITEDASRGSLFDGDVSGNLVVRQGTQGPPGPQGEKGDKGDQGNTGPRGDTGSPGAMGIQGLKGDRGEQGIQGIRGADGRTGDRGPMGTPGMDGAVGPMGNMGLKGDKGDPGAMGAMGAMGTPGAAGAGVDRVDVARNTADDATVLTFEVDGVTLAETATIPDGAQGPIGPAGAMGLMGLQGDPGDAVDGLAVTRTGTTQTLVFSVDGTDLTPPVVVPDGAQGPIGPAGAMGAMGDPGDTGNGINTIAVTAPVDGQPSTGTINFTDGTTSTFMVPAGAMGAVGAMGVMGNPGTPGAPIDNITSNRPTGATSQTLTFFVGGTSVGTITVPDGTRGAMGAMGIQGIQGDRGAPGAMGIQGHGIDGVDSERNAADTGTIIRFRSNGIYIPENVTLLDNSIRGPMGLPGMDGTPGTIGPPGPMGDPGTPGMIGPPGPMGDPGTPGMDGMDGTNGMDGAPGMDGMDGTIVVANPAGTDGNPLNRITIGTENFNIQGTGGTGGDFGGTTWVPTHAYAGGEIITRGRDVYFASRNTFAFEDPINGIPWINLSTFYGNNRIRQLDEDGNEQFVSNVNNSVVYGESFRITPGDDFIAGSFVEGPQTFTIEPVTEVLHIDQGVIRTTQATGFDFTTGFNVEVDTEDRVVISSTPTIRTAADLDLGTFDSTIPIRNFQSDTGDVTGTFRGVATTSFFGSVFSQLLPASGDATATLADLTDDLAVGTRYEEDPNPVLVTEYSDGAATMPTGNVFLIDLRVQNLTFGGGLGISVIRPVDAATMMPSALTFDGTRYYTVQLNAIPQISQRIDLDPTQVGKAVVVQGPQQFEISQANAAVPEYLLGTKYRQGALVTSDNRLWIALQPIAIAGFTLPENDPTNWEEVGASSIPSPQDTRPNIEIARAGIFNGYTDRTPLTRNADGSLSTRQFDVRGTTILETFVRQTDGTLDEKVYTGPFVEGLAPNTTDVSLVRIFNRDAMGNLLDDEWHFGTFIANMITAHYIFYPNTTRNAIRFSNEPTGSITRSGRTITTDDAVFTVNGRDIQVV